MEQAAARLLGEHDFTSFRASGCQARSPVKTMRRIAITRRGAYWRFDFEANAFLHHMIRNIMGCLLLVGPGPAAAASGSTTVLAARTATRRPRPFRPTGSTSSGPVYEDHWGLPDRTPAYDWLP
jgi:tRNA pseudouridine38-40 synthase